MTLREVSRTVISLVENVSGCPVVASEDASLKTLVASRIARGANRIHTISYNPSVVNELDYLICYQSGFILRLFGIAEKFRGRVSDLEFHLSPPTFTFSQFRKYDNVRNGSYPIEEREDGLGKIRNGGCRDGLIFVPDVKSEWSSSL